ncbi:MAG TPA: 6-phospho-3-hexuloisomerase [Methanomassiliicoccales archaeon]|nr:6-phospho-3-hexuloisomerase [Methanomassiliicoccales archaeon]HXZ24332.1 6-phospho-3-hexuloisomerase [Methanomassiliicoccales archaeon]
MRESSAYIISEVQRALERVDDRCIEALVSAIISAKKVFVYGVGRSGLVAQAFSVRLVQMGLDVHFIGESTTPIVEEGDLVLIVSNTGETMSAVQTANIVGRVGAKVALITSTRHSKLGSASNIIVEIPITKDEMRPTMAPLGTLFEASAYMFLDSLVPVLMQRMKLTESLMRKRHAIWV